MKSQPYLAAGDSSLTSLGSSVVVFDSSDVVGWGVPVDSAASEASEVSSAVSSSVLANEA